MMDSLERYLGAGPDHESVKTGRRFLDASPGRRFLFGATEYAGAVVRAMPVAGIIDDVTPHSVVHGVPVLRSSQAPRDALIVSTIVGRPLTAARVLRRLGLPFCDFFAFYCLVGADLGPMRFITGFREAAGEHVEDLVWLRSRLVDERSRLEFDRLAAFRLSFDSAHLVGFSDRQPEQYFEPFLGLEPDGEVFADIGAFDGATTEVFAEHAPGFARAHLFEPDPSNRTRIAERFSGRAVAERLRVHPVGLGAEPGRLWLSPAGSASTVSDEGSVEVEIVRFDDVVSDRVTWMKLDVEGAEAGALAGAAETIRRDHPRLAVSVYHRPADLWELARLVLGIRDDYDLHLRHYTEGVVETVLFFMPKAP